MILDPRERKSWEGLLELLQPPPGYRLSAALGTSFGVSLDALVAALLAMCDADGESLANDPVAGVMAVTRLQSKVRVLVHPGTISGSSYGGANRFVALLDRLVVEVEPPAGLFHPKVWALKFERQQTSPSEPNALGRIIVSSRNLAPSTCFELGAIFEGVPANRNERASAFSQDVANALEEWLQRAKRDVPKDVRSLLRFIRGLVVQHTPREATDALRMRKQGGSGPTLFTLLPDHIDRAVVVSPFLQPEFLGAIASKSEKLHIVSTVKALDGLDDATYEMLEKKRETQKTPVLYHVTHVGEPDGGFIDSIHAKMLILEHDRKAATFIGSANATGPGWGVTTPANVEAVVEMRPGAGVDRFLTAFVRENRTAVHPWIEEYDRTARVEPDPEQETERQMLAALRELARMDVALSYDTDSKRLTVTATKGRIPSLRTAPADFSFEFAPLLLSDLRDAWRRATDLVAGALYEDVPLDRLSAFVAMRVRSEQPPLERTRLLLARLNVSDLDLDERDNLVRNDIMATADPAAVLNALVRGFSHLRPSGSASGTRGTKRSDHSRGAAWLEGNLERLLQAVAIDPSLVSELRLLLGETKKEFFQRLCDDLEAVLAEVRTEVTS